jgi:anti-anti-sigma factor
MEINFSELGNGIRLLKLIGDLDVQGVGAIETKFAAYTAVDKPLVLVDLSEVPFIASIGIRMLVSTAKLVFRRGGKLLLVNPPPNVLDVLRMAGILELIPVFEDMDSALKALLPV